MWQLNIPNQHCQIYQIFWSGNWHIWYKQTNAKCIAPITSPTPINKNMIVCVHLKTFKPYIYYGCNALDDVNTDYQSCNLIELDVNLPDLAYNLHI